MPPAVARYLVPAAWLIAEIAVVALLAYVQEKSAARSGDRIGRP